MQSTLKELVEMQKENIEIGRQRLDIERQRLDFERLVGTQLITLVPMLGSLLQHLVSSSEDSASDSPPPKRSKRRTPVDQLDMLKDSKILRTMLEQGIKQYMIRKEKDDSSENEDSGIQNDEKSNASTKE